MEMREAGLGDLSGIVGLHGRARVAYHGAGGLPVGEILTPELAREQREGWAAAITSAHKRVRVAIVDGDVAGVPAMGPPHSPDLDPRTTAQLHQIHVDPELRGRGVPSAPAPAPHGPTSARRPCTSGPQLARFAPIHRAPSARSPGSG